jgi:exopolysaccharide production protein ExoQ
LIKFLILVGCAAGFWQFTGNGAVFQSLFLLLFFMAAAIAALQKRIAPIPLTVPELVLYGATFLSAVVAVCHSAEPSIIYSMVFLAALVLISVLARVVSFAEILDIGAAMILMLALCSIIFERAQFATSLSITITRLGLVRFSPFGNHPNLTGFIFGAGSILLARRALVTRSVIERVVMVSATLLTCVFVLAASARATVVGLIIAAVLAVIREFRPTKAAKLTVFGGLAVVIVVMVSVTGDSAIAYLEGLMEINSHTRGVGSGGSGRTDLWNQGIATLFSDPSLLLFGGGLRSSDILNIGFSTEDSYITILLDSGLFAGAALIAVLLYCPIKAISLSRSSDIERRQLVLVSSYFVFLLVESIFNRYLLAIGNPMSLFVLMSVVSLSVHANSVAKLGVKEAPGPGA